MNRSAVILFIGSAWLWLRAAGACVEIKFYGAFVLNRRVVLHAIDATLARWRGDAFSSPLDGASTAASSGAPDTLVDFHTGRRAVSRVRVLATDGRRCVVQVAIETGRTHQIRVHLAHVGAPVLGDAVYGDVSANDRAAKAPLSATRPLLHAWRLGFDHPVSRKRVEVVAPPPPDLARAVRQVSGR